jgi:hypothetical protein
MSTALRHGFQDLMAPMDVYEGKGQSRIELPLDIGYPLTYVLYTVLYESASRPELDGGCKSRLGYGLSVSCLLDGFLHDFALSS